MGQEETTAVDALGISDFFGEVAVDMPKEVPMAQESAQVAAPIEVAQEVTVFDKPIEGQIDAPKIDVTSVVDRIQEQSVDTKKTTEEALTVEQELDGMRMQFNEAMGQMSEMMTQLAQKNQTTGPELKLPDNPQEVSQLDFLNGQAPTDFLESPEAFNGLLNKVATIAARAGQQAGYEMAMRTVPSVVQSSAQQQFQLQHAADNFYKTNADLVPFKKAVSMAALDYYSKNPGATPEQILEGAAVATRNILRMRGTTAGRVPAQPAATPGVVGGAARTSGPAQLTPLEQQILDTINAAQ